MKAAVLTQLGTGKEAFSIQEVAKPTPKLKEVLIQVCHFGLNYADVMARRGLYKAAPPMPSIIGYEVVGIITEIGEEVDPSWLNKRVVAFTRFGGYAEYATTPVEACAEIGDMDAGEACCIAVQYATAYYMSAFQTKLIPGDKVLIHSAAGGVGSALIQLCKEFGCQVYANVGSDEKFEYVKSIGADHVFNYRTADYALKYSNEKFSAIFNPIGGSTFKKDFKLLEIGGTLFVFGGAERSGKKYGIFSTLNFIRKMGWILPIQFLMKSAGVKGVNMLAVGDNRPKDLHYCMTALIQLYRENKIKPFVGHRFTFNQLGEAHDLLESRKSIGKIIVSIAENQGE